MYRHYVKERLKRPKHVLTRWIWLFRRNIRFSFWLTGSMAALDSVLPDRVSGGRGVRKAHNEKAHGLVPNEIIEVNPSVVRPSWAESAILWQWDSSREKAEGSLIDAAFRVIMFTESKILTGCYSDFGDTKALHLLHIHNAITRDARRDHRGREIKHTGDGVMASFDCVLDAVECAVTIQKALAAQNKAEPEVAMHLRIGISAGEPIEEGGDLFGKAVHGGAHLCSCGTRADFAARAVRDQYPDIGAVVLRFRRNHTQGF